LQLQRLIYSPQDSFSLVAPPSGDVRKRPSLTINLGDPSTKRLKLMAGGITPEAIPVFLNFNPSRPYQTLKARTLHDSKENQETKPSITLDKNKITVLDLNSEQDVSYSPQLPSNSLLFQLPAVQSERREIRFPASLASRNNNLPYPTTIPNG